MWFWIVAIVGIVVALGVAALVAVRWYNSPDDNPDNLGVLVPGGPLIRQDLVSGRLTTLADRLARFAPDSSARYYTVHLVSHEDAYPPSRHLVRSNPTDAFVQLVHGANAIKKAWTIRGWGLAEDVDARAWPRFYAVLEEADDALARSAQRDPGDSTPLALSLIVARGLQKKESDVRSLLDRVEAIEPGHYPAFRNAIETRAAKWGGSHDEMFEIAARGASQVPVGHPSRGLSLFGHLLVWQWHALLEDDEDAGKTYLKSVVPEIHRALRESALHAQASFPSAMTQVLNDAAYVLASAGEEKAAKEIFAKIGPRWTPSPWQFSAARPSVAYRLSRWVDT